MSWDKTYEAMSELLAEAIAARSQQSRSASV
jgi:hypothetical protein